MMEYERPPIVEVVLEVAYTHPLDMKILDKLADRTASAYPQKKPRVKVEAKIELSLEDQSKTQDFNATKVGWEISTLDELDLVFLEQGKVATIRRAPYNGWEAFSEKAVNNLLSYHNAQPGRKIERVGLRYINRIDIPGDPGTSIDAYVKMVPPVMFGESPELSSYLIQYTRPAEDGIRFNIGSMSAESPVPNRYAVVLDIDVYKAMRGSLKLGDVLDLLPVLRRIKNERFEALITDESRSLFGGSNV